jgi:hypothetical protein
MAHDAGLGDVDIEDVEDAIGADRLADALDHDRGQGLGMDLVLDQGIGLMGHEDAAELGMGLQPRGEIHLAPDDRVVHPVLAAEIADGAEAGIDADAELKGLLGPDVHPFALQLPHAALHGDAHLDAGQRILAHAAGVRIAEEGEDRIADVFVDGGAEIQRDLRHLRQVVIQQTRQLLGFEAVGRLGEIGDVGEEDGQLLALGRDLGRLLAGEDRIVDLGREVFGQLPRQPLELEVGARQLVLDRLGMLERPVVEELQVRKLLLRVLI